VEATSARIVVRLHGAIIADTTDAVRVLETSHPPVYYLTRSAFASLAPAAGTSFCEFKGEAHYLDVGPATRAAWFYPAPSRGYEALLDRVAVYPSAMDSCTVDGEEVVAQEGDFYGGWITSAIVGPFKGAPGTWGW
jgi:uncharacterized protein (DUF427 family)